MLRDGYAKVAPDPKGWSTLIAKVVKQTVDFQGWPPEAMRSIKAPILVMVGDADVVRPEHAVEMFKLLPQAQLAVLPGTDHFAPLQRSDWIASMAKAFLAAPMPKPDKK